jgi:hypothetical protein
MSWAILWVKYRRSNFRKPVRFFASIMHNDDAIRASATTALAKAKYNKYWIAQDLI